MDLEKVVNEFLQELGITEQYRLHEPLCLKLGDSLKLHLLEQKSSRFAYNPVLVLSLEFDYVAHNLEQILSFMQQENFLQANNAEISLGSYQNNMLLLSTMDDEFTAQDLKARCELMVHKYQQYFS